MNELTKRKSPRLIGYDYSSPGKYFITICTHNHKQILSKIDVGEGFHPLPQNKLTPIGKEIEKTIDYINNTYEKVYIEKYIIMPNHVHLLINTTGGDGAPPLQDIIKRFKTYTTKMYGKSFWQRSFHDHIIRGEEDYKKIWEYIDTNVIRWEYDCYY